MRAVRKMLLLLVVAGTLGIAGCGHSRYNYTPGQSHVVRGGETLSIIASRYGKDHRDLARWNGLGDGSLIYPGQVIRLTPQSGGGTVASSSARRAPPPKRVVPPPTNDPSPKWVWPTSGRIVAEFNGNQGSGTGLEIAGKAGQPVRAAASGRVVYSGGGLIGYGQLIIVKHNDTYLSAYGHNASLLVREGETIKQGQRIATMGEGPGQEPRLHFEIRRNGEPVNPRQFLPRN
ncbi:MAG: peptidoglycan DD-metalloendopeptidase family protein [Woeseiaceae bacterium]